MRVAQERRLTVGGLTCSAREGPTARRVRYASSVPPPLWIHTPNNPLLRMLSVHFQSVADATVVGYAGHVGAAFGSPYHWNTLCKVLTVSASRCCLRHEGASLRPLWAGCPCIRKDASLGMDLVCEGCAVCAAPCVCLPISRYYDGLEIRISCYLYTYRTFFDPPVSQLQLPRPPARHPIPIPLATGLGVDYPPDPPRTH